MVDAARRFYGDGGRLANQGLTPNDYINPATGEIDYTRSRWSRSRWSEASELLRSRWSRSSWTMAPAEGDDGGAVDAGALALEPLALVDELGQVTLARGPGRRGAPGE